jgi:hypothetical protein
VDYTVYIRVAYSGHMWMIQSRIVVLHTWMIQRICVAYSGHMGKIDVYDSVDTCVCYSSVIHMWMIQRIYV